MAGLAKFLCGCAFADDAVFDNEGFPTCAEHGKREYGWRSPLMNYNTSGLRNDLPDWGNFYGSGGSSWVPAENIEDARDNRDPRGVWAQTQRERA